MTDFFREVDEELRNERMRRIWNTYRFWLIGAVLLIILGTAAYRGYLYWVDVEAGKSGDQYLAAMEKFETGDRAGADLILKDLAKSSFREYPILAEFRLASSQLADGKGVAALKAYDTLAKKASVPTALQNYATLQAARIALDSEDYKAIGVRLGGLLKEDNAWRDLAREVMALSAWRAGNLAEAGKWIAEIKTSQSSATLVRDRMRVLEDLIVSRGGDIPSVITTN